jgi:lipoic acid synthetase
MILGDKCTRNCRFCAVGDSPDTVDQNEPQKVARAISRIGLEYCVITSVTRDDLPDGGAQIWANTIQKIRENNPDCKIEVLIPDFKGNKESLDLVIEASPDVIGHNLETVPDLYQKVRPQADFRQSLDLIEYAKHRKQITKSGIMVGLGETNQQVIKLMKQARNAGCDLFTIGQYLQPTEEHLPVDRYVTPDEFDYLKNEGLKMGFKAIMSGPLVRSSYKAGEMYESVGE